MNDDLKKLNESMNRIDLWEAGLPERKRAREIKDQQDNQIWNAAIEAAANKVESSGAILLAHSVRELKK